MELVRRRPELRPVDLSVLRGGLAFGTTEPLVVALREASSKSR
jgi:hypothetical protein